MINRLIEMDIKPNITFSKNTNSEATINDYANAFIQGMSKTQLKRFKDMLQNNIQSGMSVARSYGVDYEQFINEVKKILFN